MKKIYIAGPLFNDMELERNCEMKRILSSAGFETYLPQEDGGICDDLVKSGHALLEVKKVLFEKDVCAIEESDILVCLLDGRVPDEGMCVELGIAWSKGKPCVGYKTDVRRFGNQGENIMIEGTLLKIVSSHDELLTILEEL